MLSGSQRRALSRRHCTLFLKGIDVLRDYHGKAGNWLAMYASSICQRKNRIGKVPDVVKLALCRMQIGWWS